MSDARICLTLRQFQELQNVQPELREILEDTLNHWPGEAMEITCIYRTQEEEEAAGGKTGVHMTTPHRAVDLRVANLGLNFQGKADAIAEVLNDLWSYDPSRTNIKVAVSEPHGSGPHVHVQVHPKTQRRVMF